MDEKLKHSAYLVLTAVLISAAYLTIAVFIFQVIVAICSRLFNDSPSPLIGATFICAIVMFCAGLALSKWKVRIERGARLGATVLLLMASVLICVSIVIVEGTMSGVVLTSPAVLPGTTEQVAFAVAVAGPLLSALVEEIAFRGILQGRLTDVIGNWPAISITSVIFVVLHVPTAGFHAVPTFYAMLSICSGILAACTKSILPSIVLHSLTNAISAGATIIFGPIAITKLPAPTFALASIVGFVSLLVVIRGGWLLRQRYEEGPS